MRNKVTFPITGMIFIATFGISIISYAPTNTEEYLAILFLGQLVLLTGVLGTIGLVLEEIKWMINNPEDSEDEE